jgi:hypothetical protein
MLRWYINTSLGNTGCDAINRIQLVGGACVVRVVSTGCVATGNHLKKKVKLSL